MIFNLVTGVSKPLITVNGGANETIIITNLSSNATIQIGTNRNGVATVNLQSGAYSFSGLKSGYTISNVTIDRTHTSVNVFPGHILWWYGRLGDNVAVDPIRAYGLVYGERDIEFTSGWQYTEGLYYGATNIYFQQSNGSKIGFSGTLKGIVWNKTANSTRLAFGVGDTKDNAYYYNNVTQGLDYYATPSSTVYTNPPSAVSINVPSGSWYPAVKTCDQSSDRAVRITALWYE